MENNKFSKNNSNIEEMLMVTKRRKKPSKGVKKGRPRLKKPKRRKKD